MALNTSKQTNIHISRIVDHSCNLSNSQLELEHLLTKFLEHKKQKVQYYLRFSAKFPEYKSKVLAFLELGAKYCNYAKKSPSVKMKNELKDDQQFLKEKRKQSNLTLYSSDKKLLCHSFKKQITQTNKLEEKKLTKEEYFSSLAEKQIKRNGKFYYFINETGKAIILNAETTDYYEKNIVKRENFKFHRYSEESCLSIPNECTSNMSSFVSEQFNNFSEESIKKQNQQLHNRLSKARKKVMELKEQIIEVKQQLIQMKKAFRAEQEVMEMHLASIINNSIDLINHGHGLETLRQTSLQTNVSPSDATNCLIKSIFSKKQSQLHHLNQPTTSLSTSQQNKASHKNLNQIQDQIPIKNLSFRIFHQFQFQLQPQGIERLMIEEKIKDLMNKQSNLKMIWNLELKIENLRESHSSICKRCQALHQICIDKHQDLHQIAINSLLAEGKEQTNNLTNKLTTLEELIKVEKTKCQVLKAKMQRILRESALQSRNMVKMMTQHHSHQEKMAEQFEIGDDSEEFHNPESENDK